MLNKTLLILIADEQLLVRLNIEKNLNHRGYYRIAPLSSFQEIKSLTSGGGEPFDLLIINATLVDALDVKPLQCCCCVDVRLRRSGVIVTGSVALRKQDTQRLLARHAGLSARTKMRCQKSI